MAAAGGVSPIGQLWQMTLSVYGPGLEFETLHLRRLLTAVSRFSFRRSNKGNVRRRPAISTQPTMSSVPAFCARHALFYYGRLAQPVGRARNRRAAV